LAALAELRKQQSDITTEIPKNAINIEAPQAGIMPTVERLN
jgi:hypothetical protein